jgi:cytochrome bd-type quinol oxidase subunit 2
MPLVNGLTSSINYWLLAGLGIILIVNLINIVKAVIRVIRKKSNNNRWFSLTSFLIIIFFVGLGYFILATATHQGPLMLFGLVKESSSLFYLVPLIFFTVAISTVRSFKQKSNKSWNIIVLASFSLFIVTALWYQLFPNF